MNTVTPTEPTLHYYACECCDATGYLPREACPMCGQTNYERKSSAGKGYVVALTRFDSNYGNGGAANTTVCLVELDERFQALGRCEPNIRIGDRVFVRGLTENIPVFDLVPG